MDCLEICGNFIFKYFLCCFIPGPLSTNNLETKINLTYFYGFV